MTLKIDIDRICYFGSLAPSVHNIQPWQFKIIPDGLKLLISHERVLTAGDPIGRETWLSIGACAENLAQAALHQGYASLFHVTTADVTLQFKPTRQKAPFPLSAIKSRFTDRSLYTGQKLASDTLQLLNDCWRSENTKVIAIDDREIIALVSKLTSQGISLALRSPNFRKELASLIKTPLRKRPIGIDYRSLRLNNVTALLEVLLVRTGLNIQQQSRKDLMNWQSASALVLTLTKGDTYKYWFEAGRAYQYASLLATNLGLRQATSAAAVEAADFHTDIEHKLGTQLRLQTIMRVGFSNAKPAYSPRLSVNELLTT